MNMHGRKMIAPVVIVICIVAYYVGVGILLTKINIPIFIKFIVFIVPIIVVILLIVVLVERINEIRKGEEDDLGKY